MRKENLRKNIQDPKRILAHLEPTAVYPMPRRYRRSNDKVEWGQGPTRRALVGKRCFDFVLSAILLVLFAPVFLLLSLWIPLESRGPVFFNSWRIGLHGRTFRLYKFRTMAENAHVHRVGMINENGSRQMMFKNKADPRVTRLGRFLRKYSLDELPQLYNVLRGDMSLIGPRPYLKEDFEADVHSGVISHQWARERHRLWPGLTGLWQVSGRNDLSFEESTSLDLHYVKHWSLRLDLIILLKTLPAVFACRGAY